ncbi:Pls/PosA family non-ribosomal peptide synthetase [Tessaracoccus sp. ZS01]|uniref:Pls/PosA family non-ribosomal peptide synthetase n=1 Tax=Tessaracoccus sp. ZS01 TaxID=1906324 RepID=UPI00096C01EB|nr:Pls/PosA family non-ribosomal peptide synthetase [Tessaracoccus sp. ZS01]MCG6567998.1 amino acid adenylation protein [Tessaracoccus sp. ZS01]OMG54263.1 amino acid adenylation protein [Tessaracoccus sp. ZS01]
MLLRSELAPPPRTLVEIFRETVALYPDEPALDNGAASLTYAEFDEAANAVADDLAARGVGIGDKVGVRIASGTLDLYIAIMGILVAGAAYVPVDADDPDERARTVFDEAHVAAVLSDGLVVRPAAWLATRAEAPSAGDPGLTDDAWVIFTSGSTGKPKGVAVTHRSAAGFVDAESRLFLVDDPINAGDRVMAGLSVAFDASCEEMWLAWRYGACLVPAPRSLVKSGMDLGPWLEANRLTVVSTVPTLLLLWPAEALAGVRLLILGGEACPPEIGLRFATPTREVWNTYGPTEATVVACAAQVLPNEPVRIGLPLDGWDLAVVDPDGHQVEEGELGELIIGGIGLARYLDPAKDAEKYAPMPTLGWDRAYRSGDLVRFDPAGLLFQGRADDQVKVGGRRIELGEIDSALLDLPDVTAAASAVRKTESGNTLLVGYVTVTPAFTLSDAMEQLRAGLPAAMVPRLAVVDDLPTRTSGKIDRDALPWPLPSSPDDQLALAGTQAWLRDLWQDVLGAAVASVDDDFFTLGGGSLTAAQMVARVRERQPEVTVADIYDHPTLAGLAAYLDAMEAPRSRLNANVRPVPRKTQIGQIIALLPLRTFAGLRWLTYVALGANIGALLWLGWVPTAPWLLVVLGWLLFIFAPGRMLLAAGAVRVVLAGIGPGAYPRGGKTHLRLWLAERIADELGAASVAGAPLMKWYARLLGADIGRDVDLHTVPPVTGMLTLGNGCSLEPEVDLTGHWLDGDTLHLGPVVVEARAVVRARSTLVAGAVVGRGAEVAPGSTVTGHVPDGEFWSGAPAQHVGANRGPWDEKLPSRRPAWQAAYAAMSHVISLIPVLGVLVGLAVVWPALSGAQSLAQALGRALAWLPLSVTAGLAVVALVILGLVRLLGRGQRPGHFPTESGPAWRAWAIFRILDEARTWLFGLYASTWTPAWLRALGAKIGPGVEASTVLLQPRLTTVAEGAFLADDTLLGCYELGGGWLRIDNVKIGRRAFLGNSGMAAPGRRVPKGSLVAVLSAAPRRQLAKRGTSYIGSPPSKLRRDTGAGDESRTFEPPTAVKVQRALVELCRLTASWFDAGLRLLAVAALLTLASTHWLLAVALSGVVLAATGVVGVAIATGVKWALVGKVTKAEYPLWSSFVWRNELADAFVEQIAAPWFARVVTGTPLLGLWFRAMGARIGSGVWCETYWLPEPDLIELRDGVSVNRGCVVQTHLFHDRVLSLDLVTMRAGSTLGPNGVILPAAVIGRFATIGPGSLVMRGESVPDGTRWIGNPIAPWIEDEDVPVAASSVTG